MTNRYDSLIGIPWFRSERFAEARLRMTDAFSIPESYDLWRERAEKREHEARRSRGTPYRVYVDDDRFIDYCRVKGSVLDSKARSQYALDFCAKVFKANVPDYSHPGFSPAPSRRQR